MLNLLEDSVNLILVMNLCDLDLWIYKLMKYLKHTSNIDLNAEFFLHSRTILRLANKANSQYQSYSVYVSPYDA